MFSTETCYRSLGIVTGLRLLVWPAHQKKTEKSSGSVAATPVNIDQDSESLDEMKMNMILKYVNSVFPPVYDKDRSVWSSMYDEVKRNHPYITVFTWGDGASAEEKAKRAVYLVTVQTMLMFLMAVCIDLEVPDNYCNVDFNC